MGFSNNSGIEVGHCLAISMFAKRLVVGVRFADPGTAGRRDGCQLMDMGTAGRRAAAP